MTTWKHSLLLFWLFIWCWNYCIFVSSFSMEGCVRPDFKVLVAFLEAIVSHAGYCLGAGMQGEKMIKLLVENISVILVGGQSARWISSGPARNITTPSTWHLDSIQKKVAFWKEWKCVESIPLFTLLIWTPSTHICFYSVFLSLCRVSAQWLQREACQPADVHWHSRWSLLEAACLLPGAPDHRENSGHGQPRNYNLQYQSSRNSSPSRKQHVSQVGVMSMSGLHFSVMSLPPWRKKPCPV